MKNALKLYDKRNDIINAFANKNIFLFAKDQKDYFLRLEPKFEESIPEKTKLKRQKKSDDKQPSDATDMPDLESEESGERKRQQRTRFKNTNTKSNAQQITNFFSTIKSRK